jgi:hypothetical protein
LPEKSRKAKSKGPIEKFYIVKKRQGRTMHILKCPNCETRLTRSLAPGPLRFSKLPQFKRAFLIKRKKFFHLERPAKLEKYNDFYLPAHRNIASHQCSVPKFMPQRRRQVQ